MKFCIEIKIKDTNELVYSTEANSLIAGFASEDVSASISFRGTNEETVLAVNATQDELTRIMSEG